MSDRKVRLFRVACCRSLWGGLTIKAAREAVTAAEQFADGLLSADQLEQIHRRGFVRFGTYCSHRNLRRAGRDLRLGQRIALAAFAIDTTSADPRELFPIDPDGPAFPIVAGVAPALLRDIVGSPFRPVGLDPAWRTSTVAALAEGMYADRAYGRLPILADALEDAGCDDADVLSHCRGPGPHARGCWVIDLLLGKE